MLDFPKDRPIHPPLRANDDDAEEDDYSPQDQDDDLDSRLGLKIDLIYPESAFAFERAVSFSRA